MSILVQGVIFYLEDYKARDGGIMTSHGKRFFAACQGFLDREYFSPVTNSNLTATRDRVGSRADMDKNNGAFVNRITKTITEIAED